MIQALKDLAKDTLTYGVASVLSQLVGFLLLPLYTTYLSPKDYGILALIAFVSLFFIPLAGLGISNAIFRRFNLYDNDVLRRKVLSTGSLFVVLSSTFLLFIALLLSPVITRFLVDDISNLFFIQLSLYTSYISSIAAVFIVVLRAQRRVRTLATIKIAQLIVTILTSIILVVIYEKGILGVLWGNFSGATLGLIWQFLASRKLLDFDFNLKELKALLAYGVPFLPHRLIAIANNFIGQYFLKTFAGLEATGLFNIALKFAMPLSFIVMSVQSAWIPIKFQIHKKEKEAGKVFRELISFYFTLILAIYLGTLCVGPEAIRFMTNEKFWPAVFIFPFTLLIPLFRGFYFMSATGFEFTNDTRPAPLVSLSGLIVLTSIGYWSVYYTSFKVFGIVAAMLFSWLMMAAVIRSFAIKRFFVDLNFYLILSILGFAVLSAFGVFFLQYQIFNIRITGEVIGLFLGLVIPLLIFLKSKDFEALEILNYIPNKKIKSSLIAIKKKLN